MDQRGRHFERTCPRGRRNARAARAAISRGTRVWLSWTTGGVGIAEPAVVADTIVDGLTDIVWTPAVHHLARRTTCADRVATVGGTRTCLKDTLTPIPYLARRALARTILDNAWQRTIRNALTTVPRAGGAPTDTADELS